jgi:hypothetical protein
MKLIRATFLLLAVCLPTTWTLAHAEEGAAGSGAETKEAKPKKKGKKKKEEKKEGGDTGDMKMEK